VKRSCPNWFQDLTESLLKGPHRNEQLPRMLKPRGEFVMQIKLVRGVVDGPGHHADGSRIRRAEKFPRETFSCNSRAFRNVATWQQILNFIAGTTPLNNGLSRIFRIESSVFNAFNAFLTPL